MCSYCNIVIVISNNNDMIVNKYINYVYLIGDSINKIMRKSMTRNDRIHSIKYDKGKKHYWNSSHRDYGIVSNFSLH